MSMTWVVCPFTNFQPPNGPSPKPSTCPSSSWSCCRAMGDDSTPPPDADSVDAGLETAVDAGAERRALMRKVAQLTKVVMHLNSKNDESEQQYLGWLWWYQCFTVRTFFLVGRSINNYSGVIFCRESTWIYGFYVWESKVPTAVGGIGGGSDPRLHATVVVDRCVVVAGRFHHSSPFGWRLLPSGK